MMPILRRAILAAAFTLAGASTAAAQAYPNHPVRVIVPYAAGGPADAISRAFAEELSRGLGQQFVAENRAGATGTIGAEVVARAAPDGYTLLITPVSPISIVPQLRKVNYDPIKDFTVISLLGDQQSGLAVHPGLGVKTLQQFIALAKTQPGKISYASAGSGGIQNLRMEVFKRMAGIDLVHVPYRGTGEAMPDVLAGNVQVMTDVIVFPQAKAGKLNLIAMMDDTRNPDFPDVPTLREDGFPDYDLPSFYTLLGPAKMPPEIVNALNAVTAKAAARPDFKERMAALGYKLSTADAAAAEKRQIEVIQVFAKHIKDVGLKIE